MDEVGCFGKGRRGVEEKAVKREDEVLCEGYLSKQVGITVVPHVATQQRSLICYFFSCGNAIGLLCKELEAEVFCVVPACAAIFRGSHVPHTPRRHRCEGH